MLAISWLASGGGGVVVGSTAAVGVGGGAGWIGAGSVSMLKVYVL